MLSDQQKDKYRQGRKLGMFPSSAISYARCINNTDASFNWDKNQSIHVGVAEEAITTEHGEVIVRLTVENDESGDLFIHGLVGEFKSAWESGCEDWHKYKHLSAYEKRNTVRWFLPEYTFDSAYSDLRMDGLGKHEAYIKAVSIVRGQMKVVSDLDDNTMWNVGVVAKAYLNGSMIGESSVWGLLVYDNEDGWSHIDECARDVAYQAVEEGIEDLCTHCLGSGRIHHG